jgi:hypothetical protein
VAGGALALVDLFAGAQHGRRRGVAQFDLADRLDAAGHRLGAQALAAGRRLAAAGHEVGQHDDDDDGHHERRDHGPDQLLGRLDGPFVDLVRVRGGVVRIAHGILKLVARTWASRLRGRVALAAHDGRRKS